MRLIKVTLLILLLLSLLGADSWQAQVVGVTDGDTVRLLHEGRETKIRLHGVDAPEAGQPFGSRAKQFVSTLAFGKTVRAEVLEQDKYGRSVALLYLEDGRCLNHELVRHGFAWWYAQYAPGDTTLATLERQAREAGLGLWGEPDPVAPWDWRRGERGRKVAESEAPRGPPGGGEGAGVASPTVPAPVVVSGGAGAQEIVYRTRTGAKYHRGGCRYLKSVIPTTVGEAVALGLGPCSKCGPPGGDAVELERARVEVPVSPRGAGSLGAGRCQAITKRGTQCKRGGGGSGYCWQHGR